MFKRFKIKRLTKKINSMYQNRINNQPTDELVRKEISNYHELAKLYASLVGKKSYPFAEIMVRASLSAAARLNDTTAQYEMAKKLLDEGKFRSKLQEEGAFATKNNENEIVQLFEEAQAYLLAAEQLGHIQAKRLRGLCYINGWGVAVDKKQGFDLVVASIDQENSWDKLPQIFAEIGLNKPEFFSALTQHRGASQS